MMRRFIYQFAMMLGIFIAFSCTETEECGQMALRTKTIHAAASAHDETGQQNPATRISYTDNEDAGMEVSWQATDAFKGFYTTSHVQEIFGSETSALFTYSRTSDSGNTAQAKFQGDVAEDADETTSFNFFYPAARSTGNTWAEAQASLLGQVQIGNNSSKHLSAYNYMRAQKVTQLETTVVPFEHLLSIMRFDLILDGYNKEADGDPCLFLLHYEDSTPFYETISASTAAGTEDSRTGNMSIGLKGISLPPQSTESLSTNELRIYFMMVPTTFPTGDLTVTIVCRNGTRYQKTQHLPADITYKAGQRYRATNFTLAKIGASVDVSEFTDNTQAASGFKTGKGTMEDPYLIGSAEELKYLIEQVNKEGYDYNDYRRKYFRLTTNISISTTEWIPLGMHNNLTGIDGTYRYFNGHLDGDGHLISGKMKSKHFTSAFIGAAGNGGSVKNLHIMADVENILPSGGAVRAAHTAGLIAFINQSSYSISNCSYSGTIHTAGGGNYAAGLVGNVSAKLTMSGCINYGSLTAEDNSSSSSTQSYVGGLIGSVQSDVHISYCSNYGNCQILKGYGNSCSGGIIGYSAANANVECRYCDNYADIHPGAGSTKVGGICGELTGTSSLHSCRNHASLSGNLSGEITLRGSIAGNISSQTSISDCCTDAGNNSLLMIGNGGKASTCEEKHGDAPSL